MGSRRRFICRMKVGNLSPESMSVGHLNRLKQRNSLGPGRDGMNFAVVHCTGYIKNWPPTGNLSNKINHHDRQVVPILLLRIIKWENIRCVYRCSAGQTIR